MQCQVIRAFTGAGGTLAPGDVVDVREWLWSKELIDQGYLRVISLTVPAPATASETARPAARPRKEAEV